MEEAPVKTSRLRRTAFSSNPDGLLSSEPLEEEMEESDEDDDKFDIDDSSGGALAGEPSITIQIQTEQDSAELGLETTKARDVGSQTDSEVEAAAVSLTHALAPKHPRSARSRSRSKSGLRSGVDTPGRYAGPTRLPPHLSDHYRSAGVLSPTMSDSSDDSLSNMDRIQRGARDDLHSSQQYFSGRSRIPRDRDVDDNVQTPTIPDGACERRNHSHPKASPREDDHQHRRAFAVWGNDETDSGTSDSDP